MADKSSTHIENFKRGDKVTVLRWQDQKRIEEIPTPHGIMQVVQTARNEALKGDVLEILAINPPYIAIKILSGKFEGKKGTLDSRECKLIHVTRQYVNALLPEKKKICEPPMGFIPPEELEEARTQENIHDDMIDTLQGFPFMLLSQKYDNKNKDSKPRKKKPPRKRKKKGPDDPDANTETQKI